MQRVAARAAAGCGWCARRGAGRWRWPPPRSRFAAIAAGGRLRAALIYTVSLPLSSDPKLLIQFFLDVGKDMH